MIKTCKKHQIEFEDYNSSLAKCSQCILEARKGVVVALKPIEHKKVDMSIRRKNRNALKPPTKKQLAIKQRQLRNKCDILWSKVVRLQGGLKCVYCSTGDNLNAHHIFSKSALSTRWKLNNGVCTCSKHHVFSSEWSFHKTPIEALEFLKGIRGENWYNELRKEHETPFDFSELEGIYNFLKQEISKFQ